MQDSFRGEAKYPPDFLFRGATWSGIGGLEDMKALEKRLAAERLLPLSCICLRERLAFKLLTMDMQRRWAREYQGVLERNLRLLGTLSQIGEHLQQRGLKVVVLRGAAMLLSVYADAGVRPLRDVEMVPESEEAATAVKELLAAQGYAESAGRWVKADDSFHLQTQVRCRRLRYDTDGLWSRARAAEPPTPSPLVTEAAPDGLDVLDMYSTPAIEMKTARDSEFHLRGDLPTTATVPTLESMRVPAPEDAFLHGLVHWVMHWPVGSPGLWAWELAHMTHRCSLDWTLLAAEARRQGLTACLHQGLEVLTSQWRATADAAVLSASQPGPMQRLHSWLLARMR